MNHDSIVGCLLGTAVGDALGLPYEGVSPKRAKRLLGAPDRYRFFMRRGMISDDTEHTCMAAQSLIESDGDVDVFTRRFSKRLRWWSLAFPAGVGKATARSCVKLWLGAKLPNSGVFSAGNGPAMRAASTSDQKHQCWRNHTGFCQFARTSGRCHGLYEPHGSGGHSRVVVEPKGLASNSYDHDRMWRRCRHDGRDCRRHRRRSPL